MATKTKDQGTDLGLEDEPFALGCEPIPERRGRPSLKADPATRRFNLALWRIASGKYDIGGLSHELAVLTGLSIEVIRDRISDIEYDPEPLEAGIGLTADDMRYFGKHYKNSDDPEVRDFYARISGGQRKHPDHENPRVGRERITTSTGTRLTSISIGLSRN